MTHTVEEIKNYIFDKKNRFLCDTHWCGCLDGYCPRYDCGCLDKLSHYSDRQWANAITWVDAHYKNQIFVDDLRDFAVEVVDYLWDKRPAL